MPYSIQFRGGVDVGQWIVIGTNGKRRPIQIVLELSRNGPEESKKFEFARMVVTLRTFEARTAK